SVAGEERRRRPTAEVVALVDVGTLIRVDAHRHETVTDERGDRRIGVGGAIHLVAGAAPRRRQREQDGLALARRAAEGVWTPRQPVDHASLIVQEKGTVPFFARGPVRWLDVRTPVRRAA